MKPAFGWLFKLKTAPLQSVGQALFIRADRKGRVDPAIEDLLRLGSIGGKAVHEELKRFRVHPFILRTSHVEQIADRHYFDVRDRRAQPP